MSDDFSNELNYRIDQVKSEVKVLTEALRQAEREIVRNSEGLSGLRGEIYSIIDSIRTDIAHQDKPIHGNWHSQPRLPAPTFCYSTPPSTSYPLPNSHFDPRSSLIPIPNPPTASPNHPVPSWLAKFRE